MPYYQVGSSCHLCGNSFEHDAHAYGHFIPRYQMTVCMACWNGNWDGWSRHWEPKLLAHPKAHGLPIPEHNERGLLPRE